MRDLVAALGAETIAREAGLALSSVPHTDRTALPSAFLGVHLLGTAGFLGLGLPFGRITAGDFADLASSAASMGAHDLRLTPWRAILIPVPSVGRARSCRRNWTDVHSFWIPRTRDAASPPVRAPLPANGPRRGCGTMPPTLRPPSPGIRSDTVIHISGCAKGCAHPCPAAVTLVGRDGRYDLVRNDVASGSPAERGLTLAQAVERMRGGAA